MAQRKLAANVRTAWDGGDEAEALRKTLASISGVDYKKFERQQLEKTRKPAARRAQEKPKRAPKAAAFQLTDLRAIVEDWEGDELVLDALEDGPRSPTGEEAAAALSPARAPKTELGEVWWNCESPAPGEAEAPSPGRRGGDPAAARRDDAPAARREPAQLRDRPASKSSRRADVREPRGVERAEPRAEREAPRARRRDDERKPAVARTARRRRDEAAAPAAAAAPRRSPEAGDAPAPTPAALRARQATRAVVTPDAPLAHALVRTKARRKKAPALASSTSLPKLPGAFAKPSPPQKRSPKKVDYALFSWPGADDAPRAVSPAGLPSSLDFLEDDGVAPC